MGVSEVPRAEQQCPTCNGTGEKLPVVIRNCALVDITCPACDGAGVVSDV